MIDPLQNRFSKIHPELQQVARTSPRFVFNKWSLWYINLLMRLRPAPKPPAEVRIDNIVIPGLDGRTRVRVRRYRPLSTPAAAAVLVWLHGGGYVVGRPEQDDWTCTQFVRELGIPVVSVDYRRAPQHPFPAGLEDGYAALKWAAGQTEAPRSAGPRIAIGGASAGGGLAAALAQLAYDRQEVRPAFQLLVYPMLDDRTALRTDIDDSLNITWNQKSNRFGWEAYLGRPCGAEELPAYAAAARRQDLAGLPPAWIGVGTLDVFYDEDVAYGQRLKECGGECETVVVPGAFHGFDVFDARLPVVRAFRQAQIAALRKYLL